MTNLIIDPEKLPTAQPSMPPTRDQDIRLTKISTALSHELPMTHEAPAQRNFQSHETTDDAEVYHRFSPLKKRGITAILCLLSFLGSLSSTTILSAVPDVATDFNTTGTIVNLSNAFYLVMCAISPCVCGPLSELYGRRLVYIPCVFLFLCFSLGTALSSNLPAFFTFRILTGFEGAAFLIVGAATIGDIYRPTERGTAMGWFLSGTLIGPALGPFIGGVITNFQSWRVIFWVQTAMSAIVALLVIFFLPETAHSRKIEAAKQANERYAVIKLINPLRPVALFKYPNLLTAGIATSALAWNMYSFLTPIRYVLNPRFHLTSPLLGGLFFLAPGCGYLMGTFIGGRYADYVVKRWIKKRNGDRRPQDRLRSCLVALGGVIPGCMLIYGWGVEKEVGGYPLPIIVMFIQGISQSVCFSSLNTYCVDVMQHRSSEVVGGNYLIRYIFAAVGSAMALPAITKIGIGWFSTISAGFLIVSAGLVQLTIMYGEDMKRWAEERGKPSSGEEA